MVSGSSFSKDPSVIGGDSYAKLLHHSQGSNSQKAISEFGDKNNI